MPASKHHTDTSAPVNQSDDQAPAPKAKWVKPKFAATGDIAEQTEFVSGTSGYDGFYNVS